MVHCSIPCLLDQTLQGVQQHSWLVVECMMYHGIKYLWFNAFDSRVLDSPCIRGLGNTVFWTVFLAHDVEKEYRHSSIYNSIVWLMSCLCLCSLERCFYAGLDHVLSTYFHMIFWFWHCYYERVPLGMQKECVDSKIYCVGPLPSVVQHTWLGRSI
jgi:hypothetical protein